MRLKSLFERDNTEFHKKIKTNYKVCVNNNRNLFKYYITPVKEIAKELETLFDLKDRVSGQEILNNPVIQKNLDIIKKRPDYLLDEQNKNILMFTGKDLPQHIAYGWENNGGEKILEYIKNGISDSETSSNRKEILNTLKKFYSGKNTTLAAATLLFSKDMTPYSFVLINNFTQIFDNIKSMNNLDKNYFNKFLQLTKISDETILKHECEHIKTYLSKFNNIKTTKNPNVVSKKTDLYKDENGEYATNATELTAHLEQLMIEWDAKDIINLLKLYHLSISDDYKVTKTLDTSAIDNITFESIFEALSSNQEAIAKMAKDSHIQDLIKLDYETIRNFDKVVELFFKKKISSMDKLTIKKLQTTFGFKHVKEITSKNPHIKQMLRLAHRHDRLDKGK
jgi:hypothetical protein